jgi:hypothetical protein
MISEADLVVTWIFITVVVVGLFLAFCRALDWYRSRSRYDPLQPDTVETRYSLRREK